MRSYCPQRGLGLLPRWWELRWSVRCIGNVLSQAFVFINMLTFTDQRIQGGVRLPTDDKTQSQNLSRQGDVIGQVPEAVQESMRVLGRASVNLEKRRCSYAIQSPRPARVN
ncbi:uncharacterized protein LOC144306210 isoform X1 [Canis aureus]